MGERAQWTELVEGELIHMSPASGSHGAIAAEIAWHVTQFVRENKLGQCFVAETGFLLATNPDTVRAPDFAFVSKDRLPPGRIPDGFFPGAPDLAVEVLSDSETYGSIEGKLDDYFAGGAKLVWIVAPDTQEVRVYTDRQSAVALTIDDHLTGQSILPGFRCAVADIFV